MMNVKPTDLLSHDGLEEKLSNFSRLSRGRQHPVSHLNTVFLQANAISFFSPLKRASALKIDPMGLFELQNFTNSEINAIVWCQVINFL